MRKKLDTRFPAVSFSFLLSLNSGFGIMLKFRSWNSIFMHYFCIWNSCDLVFIFLILFFKIHLFENLIFNWICSVLFVFFSGLVGIFSDDLPLCSSALPHLFVKLLNISTNLAQVCSLYMCLSSVRFFLLYFFFGLEISCSEQGKTFRGSSFSQNVHVPYYSSFKTIFPCPNIWKHHF